MVHTTNTDKLSIYQKDIQKGQKILAAVYMVTSHLPETDPIVRELRSCTTSFVCAPQARAKELLVSVETLLGAAVLAGLIGEKNSSVISYEARHFYENIAEQVGGGELRHLFGATGQTPISKGHSIKDTKRTQSTSLTDTSQRPKLSLSNTRNPSDIIPRGDKILSFINDRKSAGIKDIVSLFPDVSEKTVQRELNRLLEEGKINKRGSKRWSIYMAVNSLL
ncbi:MAG: DeoR family transcriptional regulator [Patescibacteria group bacterium]